MASKSVDTLVYNSSSLLTIKGKHGFRVGEDMKELSIIDDGAIAIKDGIIVDVDNTKNIYDIYKDNAKCVIDAEKKLIIPGFVDCHTHLVFGGTREYEFPMKVTGASYLDILEKGGGIHSTVNTTRMMSKDDLVNISIEKLDKMLACGTTLAEIKSGYGLDYNNEKKMLEVIKELQLKHCIDLVPTYLGAHVFPKNIKKEDYMKLMLNEALPDFVNLAEYCDIFIENNAFNIEEADILLSLAKELGYKIKVHAGQFNDLGGVELASKIGAISVDHVDTVSKDQLKYAKKSKTALVLLPGIPFFLMTNKYADARYMINNGNIVALATDFNPGSCPTYSMLMIIALACYKMKMLPSEAIVASTINAAYALNRDKYFGSIEKNKYADIIILDVDKPEQIPYYFGVNLVKHVIKSGKLVI